MPIQFFYCFISHSLKDKDFASWHHAELQNFVLPRIIIQIGTKTWDKIDDPSEPDTRFN